MSNTIYTDNRHYRDTVGLYNLMWEGQRWNTTRHLYHNAAASARFGVHLQNEVLVRMGIRVVNHRTRKHYSPAASAFLTWMVTETEMEILSWGAARQRPHASARAYLQLARDAHASGDTDAFRRYLQQARQFYTRWVSQRG